MKQLKRIPKLTDMKRNKMMRIPRGAEVMSPNQPQESASPGVVVGGGYVRLNVGEVEVVVCFMSWLLGGGMLIIGESK